MRLVKLYADWCGPCKVLESMLQVNNIEHESVNVDSPEGQILSDKYSVRAIPTLLILDENNNLVRKMTGMVSLDDLKKFVYEADWTKF